MVRCKILLDLKLCSSVRVVSEISLLGQCFSGFKREFELSGDLFRMQIPTSGVGPEILHFKQGDADGTVPRKGFYH